jgi:predicted RNA polymerase sigma factor
MPALPVEIIARILSNLVDPIVPLHKSKDSIYLPLDLVNATQVWPREGKRWLREVVRIRSSEGARKFMEGLLMEREQEELDDENDDERIEQLEDEHGAVHGKPIRVRQLEFCGAGDEDNGQRLAELLSYCTGLDGLWLMETRLKSNVRDFGKLFFSPLPLPPSL